jgi:predicted Zn finger-like uncharacterized protein
MVVLCPKCKTKLKLDDDRVAESGTKFKCPKCTTAFIVKKPTPKPPQPEPPQPPGEPVAPEAQERISPEAQEQITPEMAEAMEKARRLARTIMSDIWLYNSKKVENSIRNDTFFNEFGDDIKEGLKLYNSRVSEAVRAARDIYRESVEDFLRQKRLDLGL